MKGPPTNISFPQRLTPADIRAIRARLEAGEPRRSVAKAFRVGKVTIDRIARGDTYAWVEQTEGDEDVQR